MKIEEQVIQAADEAGEISDQSMMGILTGVFGGQGDTSAKADEGSEPDAAVKEDKPVETKPEDAPSPAAEEVKPEAKDEPTPVILAKDGKHTIDYQKLVDARAEAAAAKAEAAAAKEEARQLAAEIAEARKAKPAAADPTEPATEETTFGDYTDADLRKGVEQIVNKRVTEAVSAALAQVDQKLQPTQKAAYEAALTAHNTTIYTAHPDINSVLESTEFAAWRAAQPSFTRTALDGVLEKGNAGQIVELMDSYKLAHPAAKADPTPAPAAKPAAPTKEQLAAEAEKRVAEAKSKSPTSLSDIPAGTKAHHDDVEAMNEMSGPDLMFRMMNMSREQIETQMKRFG